jgi:hypothetical protein
MIHSGCSILAWVRVKNIAIIKEECCMAKAGCIRGNLRACSFSTLDPLEPRTLVMEVEKSMKFPIPNDAQQEFSA